MQRTEIKYHFPSRFISGTYYRHELTLLMLVETEFVSCLHYEVPLLSPPSHHLLLKEGSHCVQPTCWELCSTPWREENLHNYFEMFCIGDLFILHCLSIDSNICLHLNGLRIFSLYFELQPNISLFCSSSYCDFGHWKPFQLAPVSL